MMPNAIPSVQNTAMAESSRMSFRLLSHSTPNADSTEKTAVYFGIALFTDDQCLPMLFKHQPVAFSLSFKLV